MRMLLFDTLVMGVVYGVELRGEGKSKEGTAKVHQMDAREWIYAPQIT